MKKLVIIQVLLLMSLSVIGKCLSESLTFWPNNNDINLNSIFVIDGYGSSQEIIMELGKAHRVFLKSKNEEVELIVTEVNVGLYHLSQAVLKPITDLSPNTEYKLIIRGIANDKVKKYNTETHIDEDVVWTTSNSIDKQAPIWTALPVEFDKFYQEYGCGPATYVNFKYEVKEKSEMLFRVTLKSLDTDNENAYYIQIEDGMIKVGHGMCSGAFDFIHGRRYSAKIDILDSSGNISKWTDSSIIFTKP